MERSSDVERTLLERSWLDAHPQLKRDRNWNGYRNTMRNYLHHMKRFVIWDVVDGKPRIVDLVRSLHVGVSWDQGVEAIFESALTDQLHTVTSVPREFIPGVFMWIPGFSDVRFTPMRYSDPTSARRLTLPICFRTRHSGMQEGARHITEYAEFEKSYPGIF